MRRISVSTVEIEIPVPTYEETVKAIKIQKSNKAAGSDDIPAECIRYGGETLHTYISLYKTPPLPMLVWTQKIHYRSNVYH